MQKKQKHRSRIMKGTGNEFYLYVQKLSVPAYDCLNKKEAS